jgi:hypothetical protein
MVKYDADEVQVQISDTLAGLTTAPVVPNLSALMWDVDQGIVQVADGIGFRTTTSHEKLIKYKGQIKRWYDELKPIVSGDTGQFAKAVGAYNSTNDLTRLFIQITNKTTSKFVILNNVIGKYSRTVPSPEGYVEEVYDFFFDSITGEV